MSGLQNRLSSQWDETLHIEHNDGMKKRLKREISSGSLSPQKRSESALKFTRIFNNDYDFPFRMSCFSITKSFGCLA